MPERVDILTPENVTLSYELAGLGSRFYAALADLLLQGLGGLIVVFGATSLASGGAAIGWTGGLANWALALVIILLFLIFWGYHVLFETRWSGQTPGKKSVGIRVICDGGYPVDFRATVIRNLVRYADFLPSFYAAGALAIFFSKQSKRLGDFAAGTIVIKERGREDTAPRMRATASSPPLDDAAQMRLAALTVEDYRAVRHFLDRMEALPAPLQQELARKLSAPLREKLGGTPPEPSVDLVPWLASLAAAYENLHRL